MSPRVETALRAAATLACALWLGGLVALGAIAAPAVFGLVPAPYSGDAMTTAFRRFDRVALTCAIVVLACELAAARLANRRERQDLVRGGAALAAAALAAIVGAWASPRIEELHLAGALRGLGALGNELDRVHRLAEWAGKGQVVLLALYLVMVNRAAPAASIEGHGREHQAEEPASERKEAR